ncbi:MAG: TMEM165/GDT1 family protein [Proteobacteria bacterium]|nr:MAG: TMEM165/GDT1 family protein [Pseudomonadota bacterium]
MEVVFNSFLIVALSEMGDKTQLLAFILASRFKKPWPVFWGIFVATLLNHALAAWAGEWVSSLIPPTYLKYGLAAIFIAFAIWVLIPDKVDDELRPLGRNAFLTTTFMFFLAEMGDKTQLATVALAARYHDLVLVTLGTTLGMMLSNGAAVFFGDKMAAKISMVWMHRFAALFFIIFAIGALIALPG